MKTGTEALSARLLSEPLPDALIVPRGDAWPQNRTDIAKHPELELLGTRRGAPINARLEAVVAEARSRDVPEVTILFIAEALGVVKHPEFILNRMTALADSVEVVFFARHQTAALPSIVAHRVQSWTSPAHLELTRDALFREAPKRFHYDRFLERWSGEGHRLIAVPYFEDDRVTDGLMSRFAVHTGIRIPPPTSDKPKNASLGRGQLDRLAALKRKWEWARTIPIARSLAEKLFFAARKKIQREQPSPAWKLTAAERRAIFEFYRESNARFKKLLGSSARTKDWKRWFAELEAPRSR